MGILVFLTTLSSSFAQSSLDEVIVTLTDNGASIIVVEGQVLVVKLEAQPGTGYGWQVDTLPPILQQTGERSTEPLVPTQSVDIVGDTVYQVFQFQPIHAGQDTLTLVYRRPWEVGVDPLQTFTIQIETQGDFLTPPPPLDVTPTPEQLSPTPDMGPDLGLPSAFNWCSQGGCTVIKNQGSCGSCWAFATVGVVESAIKRIDGIERDLSEQYLVSAGTHGSCSGGYPAFSLFIDEIPTGEYEAGAVYEAAFPYQASDVPLNPPHVHHEKLTSDHYVSGTVADIKQAIYDHGPVYTSVCSSGSGFQGYTSGVYMTDESYMCPYGTDHAVVLVGWDDSKGAWRMRNSWGTWWGDNGYMWIGYGVSNIGGYAIYGLYDGAAPSTYTIDGYVQDSAGNGISGVTVDFGGSQPAVTTSSSGYYSQTGFGDGSYTVSASRSGYAFSPYEDTVTVSGGAVTHDITGSEFTPTSLPFSDDFESGSLGNAWAIETDYEGRTNVGTGHAYAGSYSLNLDDSTGNVIDSHAAAILALDLSGQSDVELSFWWREYGDEDDPDDGVFISDDNGVTWQQIFSFNGGPSSYTQETIDLDAEASAAGMNLTSQFLIKFQFYDDYPISSDGYTIDDINISTPLSPPDTPTGLAAYPVSLSELHISWVDNSDNEDGVILERSLDNTSGSWTQIAILGADVESYNDSNVTCGMTYYYRIYAYNAAGNSLPWKMQAFTSDCPVTDYTIDGYVQDSAGNGITGVTVDFGGSQPAVTTNSSGYYSQTGFGDGSYTVSASRSGYAFSPYEDTVTVSGGAVTHDITGSEFTPTSLPFSDDFESGSLGNAWAIETDYEGRTNVGTGHAYAGSYSLHLDDAVGNSIISHAAAILALDLSGQSDVDLSFWWREYSDEDDLDDGVFISDDNGVTWQQIFSFNGGPSSYTQETIDLDAEASAAGMNLTSQFLIKFQFYDDYSISTDGYTIDDVQVTVGAAPGLTGDCNADGAVNAADISALVLRLFDPTQHNNPGCDANSDGSVSAADVSAIVILINGGTVGDQTPNGDVQLATVAQAHLTMGTVIPAEDGSRSLPLILESGETVSSLFFSIDYDEQWYTFDPTDHDDDGIPDALQFTLPEGFSAMVQVDATDTDGEVDILIADVSYPLTAVPDGALATLTLEEVAAPPTDSIAATIGSSPAASFGNTSGQSIAGRTDNMPTTAQDREIYLPIIVR
jgi:inhibitor of cysteine peptidase